MAIWYFNEKISLEEAIRVDRLIEQAGNMICSVPFVGIPGQVHGTHELVPEPNCRVIYQIGPAAIVILTVVHGAFAATGRW